MPSDFLISILEDGTISIKTSDIASAVHQSADELLEELEDMLGGEVNRQSRKEAHAHAHAHGHAHKHVKAGH